MTLRTRNRTLRAIVGWTALPPFVAFLLAQRVWMQHPRPSLPHLGPRRNGRLLAIALAGADFDRTVAPMTKWSGWWLTARERDRLIEAGLRNEARRWSQAGFHAHAKRLDQAYDAQRALRSLGVEP